MVIFSVITLCPFKVVWCDFLIIFHSLWKCRVSLESFFFLKLFLLAWLTFWQKVSAVCSHWGSDTKNQTSCQSLTLLGEAPVNGQSPSSQCLYHPSGLAPVSEGLRLWTYTKTCADMRRHLTMLTKSSFSALNKCHRWFTRGQERMMPSPQQHVLEP